MEDEVDSTFDGCKIVDFEVEEDRIDVALPPC